MKYKPKTSAAPFNSQPRPPMAQQQPSQDDPDGFSKFLGRNEFANHIHGRALGDGQAFVPFWVHPSLIDKLYKEHGQTGHIIPHQDYDFTK